MELDKFNQADKLLVNIDWNKNKIRRINEFLGGNYDRVSKTVNSVLGDGYDYSRLDNAVDAELKAYRDRLEKEIEQLKKEFEAL